MVAKHGQDAGGIDAVNAQVRPDRAGIGRRLAVKLVLGAWAAVILLFGLLEAELRLRVVHLFCLPCAFLLLILLICTLGTVLLGLIRAVRGPDRIAVLGLAALGLLPALLVYAPCEYVRRHEESRDFLRGFAFDFASALGASLMEGEAQYLYPHRLQTPHLVMYYRSLANPSGDIEEMERHVVRLQRLLGRPLRAPIHWV